MRVPLLLGSLFLFSGLAGARDIYVSSSTGATENSGAKDSPKKLLWQAMDEMQAGDVIRVAEGLQHGKQKSGVMPKQKVGKITLEGGWKADFSVRDPFRYLTIIVAGPDDQGSTSEVFQWEDSSDKSADVTIDGFVIDRGQGAYYFSDGEPGANKRVEGHSDNSAWGYRQMNRKKSGSDPSIELIGKGSFTIRNNIIIGSPWWGIYVKAGGGGTTTIENNLVFISQGRGIEAIAGGGWGDPTFVIRNNTVVFNHGMPGEGRALSIDPRPGAGKYIIENNVLGFSDESGVSAKFGAKGDLLQLNNNLFFFNRKGDFGSGGNGVANVKDFGDEVEFKNKGNTHEVPKFLGKSAKPWFDRYSIREYNDMLAGGFNKWEELQAARAVFELGAYQIPGYDKTFATYAELPDSRNNYDMSRYPQPFKKGDVMNWQEAVLPMIGADAPHGIVKFKAK